MNFLNRLCLAFASETAGHVLLPHRSLWHLWRKRKPPTQLAEAKSILVIRLDEIGDLILSSAFFRELRRNAPRARITVLVKPACRDLLSECPHIDSVEVFREPVGEWSPLHWFRLRKAALAHGFLRSFSRRFDLVLLPRRSPDFRDGEFLAFASGFSCVVALDDHAAPCNREGRYRRSFTEARFPVSKPVHDADFGLELIERLGGKIHDRSLEVWTTPADEAAAEDFLSTRFDAQRPLAVIHPSGGNSLLKQWPVKHFVAVAQILGVEFGLQWLVVGGNDEAWIRDSFPSGDHPKIVVAPGQFPLRTLAAIFKRSRLFVGGDSGPMHLAVAAGTCVIAAFGPTSELRFAPRGPRDHVVSLRFPCSPDSTGTLLDRCQQCIYPAPRCLNELPVDKVLDAARAALQGGLRP